MPKTPTKRTYDDFDAAYAYFNKRLFGGRLPPCLITVRPHRGAYGYFSSERFGSRDGKEIHDEIALNIRHFEKRSPCEILSTLVHEMVHLEQAHFGSPSRNGYHNSEWAGLMERVGLMPSDTGAPGGKRTGQRMTHYIVPDGPFDKAFRAHTFAVPYYDRAGESDVTRKKRRVAYTCPSCEDKVWGTPKVQPHCGKCGLVAMIASYDTNRIATAVRLSTAAAL
jgi:predicted SprT family Zn-dependent metalloprotease